MEALAFSLVFAAGAPPPAVLVFENARYQQQLQEQLNPGTLDLVDCSTAAKWVQPVHTRVSPRHSTWNQPSPPTVPAKFAKSSLAHLKHHPSPSHTQCPLT